MVKFVPGLDLADGYYRDVVAPLLGEKYPNLPHAAALMGAGSDVLGYDTEMSTDHSWGPRFQLFVSEDAGKTFMAELSTYFAENLPYEYRGFPTHFIVPDPGQKSSFEMSRKESGSVNHKIEITTLASFSRRHLGVDATQPLAEDHWLATPQSLLLTMTSGRVFHDEVGLGRMRGELAWYPRDVWLFYLGCVWLRLRRLELTIGRMGQSADDLGVAVALGNIVTELMRLAFAMENTYTPYSKWVGRAFQSLQCAALLGPQIEAMVHAPGWAERDMALSAALETCAAMHNALSVTKKVPEKVALYKDRGFHTIRAIKFSRALIAEIKSPRLGQLFKQGVYGPIDLITDSRDTKLSVTKGGRVLRMFEG